jgi:hypothetical protein
MKFKRNKIIIFSLFIALVNLFALGCFFTSQSLMNSHNNMASMECCNMGTYNYSEHAGYNLQYNLVNNVYPQINFISVLFLAIFFIFKDNNFLSYCLVKDRYGGFKLFYKFLLLFKTGILHPKLY